MAPELEHLIAALARLPGIGPRSARRLALHLLGQRETVMDPLIAALSGAAAALETCRDCGALSSINPCEICTSPMRDQQSLCVVERLGDMWALERAGMYRGRYLILGGVLSALDGVGPEALGLERLDRRMAEGALQEVILALSATVDGQTTAHYLGERLAGTGVKVTRLARGVPVGGSLDYLDDGTLLTAFTGRAAVSDG